MNQKFFKKINQSKIIPTALLLYLLVLTPYSLNSNLKTMLISNNEANAESISNIELKSKDFETDPSKGRNFGNLSFNPDGTELMFSECYYYQDEASKNKKYPDGNCGIFRLNLKTNQLRHYDLPDQDKYFYSDGAFSPKGNFVVMKRSPRIKYDPNLTDDAYEKLSKTKEHQEQVRQNSESSEIAMMKADGTNFQILQTPIGLKGKPVMSNDETKIAYFRGSLRKAGSKTPAAGFDIMEIDLKTKEVNLFAGPYEFFSAGNLQYLQGDNEILVGAYGPRDAGKDAFEMGDYFKKYNNSSIYVIKRGDRLLAEPMVFDGARHTYSPFLGRNNNLYFYGEDIKKGMSFFRKDKNGNIIKWLENLFITKVEMQGTNSVISSPDEKYILFIYEIGFNRFDRSKRGIAILSTKTSEWKQLDVPYINSSKPIPAIVAKIIKAKPQDKFKLDFYDTKKLFPSEIK